MAQLSIFPQPSFSLPVGAATSANQVLEIAQLTTVATNTSTTNTTLSSINTKLPAQGQALMAASMPVTLASNQSTVPVQQKGRTSANTPVRNVYSVTNVTTGAYVQLIASTTSAINRLQIFDSSGQTMALATGASGSEVIQCYIFPGGIDIDLSIAAGTRVSLIAISGTASVGEIDINLLS